MKFLLVDEPLLYLIPTCGKRDRVTKSRLSSREGISIVRNRLSIISCDVQGNKNEEQVYSISTLMRILYIFFTIACCFPSFIFFLLYFNWQSDVQHECKFVCFFSCILTCLRYAFIIIFYTPWQASLAYPLSDLRGLESVRQIKQNPSRTHDHFTGIYIYIQPVAPGAR